jgi:hypothetical protein
MASPEASRYRFTVPATLALLTFLIYGRHLVDGYLADDFLFLSWWNEGLGELLRRVTVDANPRMIRPLPALAWGLYELPGGAAVHHALSLVVHAACAWMVARLARRGSGSEEVGWMAGALFVCFPLFTEPVIWLSAAPDLWACLLALAALDATFPLPPGPPLPPTLHSLPGEGGSRGTGGGALSRREGVKGWERVGVRTLGKGVRGPLLFALSLLCKESTVTLPLVLLCLAPWRQIRRPFLALSAVAVAYLGVRLLLFGGPGGYLGPAGQALALQVDPLRFLRNLTLQFPYRLLIPLKRAGDLAPWLAVLSAMLAGAAVAGSRLWQRPRVVLRTAAATLAALLPVAAFFSVSYDHENTRMLYFPVAVLMVALAAAVPRPAAVLRAAALALIALWSLLTVANGRSWSTAGREVRQTLAVMRAAEPRFPAGATVLVAGHDTWHGAYVWRNGLAFAARLHGLRDDLHWTLGTAATIPRPEDLGRRAFEIGVGADGEERDWTACQQALWTAPLEPLGGAEIDVAGRRLDSGPIRLRRPSSRLAVEIRLEPGQRAGGRLRWRHAGIERFNVSDSRSFEAFPGRDRAVVRLPAFAEPLTGIELRLETSEPLTVREVRVVETPSACG